MKKQNDLPDSETAENKELSIWGALIPVIVLVALLYYNVYVYGDASLDGTNQLILLLGAAVAAGIGVFNKVKFEKVVKTIAKNIKSTAGAILILLLVGALTGTWMMSGIIPTMIYYGMQVISPSVFLASCVVICCIISLVTGSSWTTSATVGIALIGIAKALDISLGMTAGAIISGAYFGDKVSPLSDTTNLAAAVTGTDLFVHIRYLMLTTIPTILVTLVVFVIIGLNFNTEGVVSTEELTTSIASTFHITPWLFIVPVIVIFLIIKKTSPLIALLIGTLLGGIAMLLFQPEILAEIAGVDTLTFQSAYRGVMDTMTVSTSIVSDNETLDGLFKAGGMSGMLNTIWLIICAMAFGGAMEAIGALMAISKALLNLFHTTFGLFASAVASCLALNATASDQYLTIVVPGKMFGKAFKDKNLAPENLGRTIEDAGTVTSVLVPWNTCGAYHSGVLGVSVIDYFVYAIFNWLSPFMTLIVAGFNIKIRQLQGKV